MPHIFREKKTGPEQKLSLVEKFFLIMVRFIGGRFGS
jgi:hypothetical protein